MVLRSARKNRFRGVILLAFAALCSCVAIPAGYAAAPAAAAITVDTEAAGLVYQGAGAVSAGASTRLLYDYPERQRGQILDYLFKPGFGAQLQILKVEIGSETNSTSGSEPSHEREPGRVDCGRGYEWWLMREAKQRNPRIKLAGLAWGAPGWQRGGFWSEDNIDYHLRWLDCAERQGLRIDYMGGWNERGYEPDWYVDFAAELARRYPHVRLIGADECCRSDLWRVADTMVADPAFRAAVDDVGVHFACGHRTDYANCASTETARSLGKPLWMSENSALTHKVGAGPHARALNRGYLDAGLGGYMTWPVVSAWYANLPIADTGLLLAEWPWSGHYELGKNIWAFAHTTQFADPGWRYLPSASGALATGATFVTRAAPKGRDFSTVVETMDADQPTRIALRAVGAARSRPLHVWASDLRSDDPRDHFVRLPVSAGTVDVPPGHVYTITTLSSGGKGVAPRPDTLRRELPLPFRADFDDDRRGGFAPYFSALNGAFETVRCAGGRAGNCYQQQTTAKPLAWGAAGEMPPTTLVGDPRWWGDYEVSAKVRLRKPGSAELLGRVSSQTTSQATIGGYFLTVSSENGWQLASRDQYAPTTVLATGEQRLDVGRWHDVALRMRGSQLSVLLDGKRVATVTDDSQRSGNVGLRTGGFERTQFDEVRVRRTAPWPQSLPQQQMSAGATSTSDIARGYDYYPANVLDDRPESLWKPAAGSTLPQAITLDLGTRGRLGGLLVQPQYEVVGNAPITGYRVAVSDDGSAYRTVATGSWAASWSTKRVTFPRGTAARFVRFEVLGTSGTSGTAGIGELNVLRG